MTQLNSGEHLRDMVYTPIETLPKKRLSFGSGLDYSIANSSLLKQLTLNIVRYLLGSLIVLICGN